MPVKLHGKLGQLEAPDLSEHMLVGAAALPI
jgi:hypothetical protein